MPDASTHADPSNTSNLLDLARAAAANAYSPYSGFKVGASIVTTSGRLFAGCNVENASYGLTICAERNAIFQAVAAEGPGMRLAAVAVVCLDQEFPPCGACRQVIHEFATPATTITFLQQGAPATLPVTALLPGAFNLQT
jgi:cytidine deaminase